ncbi:GPH family glycoside/pentoside/hexuronide:cation symporter [Enterobacter sp. BIGb0383]|uniref:MFS transporter n=1 Tax=unclassified Enterobacter TaxID=2608935 RepID=UPI000F4A4669|nr:MULTISPECIES: MFS transporter [unclassified Enterobacter]ROP49001.1 GPH family glycoside/pentoside/hexuronide:cation symporter [Enterobacter sp. BIGb0383]ROS00613.1 GPH family glycoside/pentoside/hexuronide:cation symporter [Enterobacter sp. BIGb0359]
MKLSIREKIGFGAGDSSVAIVLMSTILFLSFFYTDIFGLKPTDMGIMFIVVKVFDAIIDPLIGIATDHTKTRWGKYRPYLLFSAIPFGISIWLLFTTPSVDYSLKLAWAYATYVVMTLFFTLVSIPYVSLIGVISDDPQERLSANSYRFVMTKIVMFAVGYIVPLGANYFGKGSPQAGYQITMGAMAILATLLCLYCFATVKERVHHPKSDLSLKDQMKSLFKNEQWLILAITIAVMMAGGVIRGSVSFYYALYYLTDSDYSWVSLFFVAGVVASVLSMLSCSTFTRAYDKIKVFRHTQFLAFALGVLMYFIVQPGDLMLGLIFYVLITYFAEMQLPIYWASIAEAVDYGEAKTGKRVSGLAFGFILFFQKIGIAAAGGFVGFALTYYGYQPGTTQSAATLVGLSLMMTIFPALTNLMVSLIMKKYIINDKYYEEIKKTLRANI